MKKVLCQMCGLMNLDKFVTYPHCAGCGTRLAETEPPKSYESWKRPLRAPLWASMVGLCCAGLGYWAITIARETGHPDEKQLVAYVLMTHEMKLGESTKVQLNLDTTEADNNLSVQRFSDVRLRLPGSNFENFTLTSVSPLADLTSEGKGRYLVFDTLSRDEPIVLELHPLHPGKSEFVFGLYVRDFTPYDYRTSIKVTRPEKGKMTHSSQQPNSG